jgi:hypothetical protein
MAGLPVEPPVVAQPLLLRARALHSRVIIETERLTEALELRRGARRRARRMARTYAPPPVPQRWSTSA